MRFFSKEVCDAFDDAEAFSKVYGEYRQYLEGLRGVLPERVIELAEPSGMEDALVVQVNHDRERRVLRLVLRCGHLQMGYYNLVLTYEDAELLPEHDVALATIAHSTKTQRFHGCDLAYHELDAVEGGKIEHSMIFHASSWHHPSAGGWMWFSVRCSALTWRREPKKSRRLPPIPDRYPDGPQV